VVAILSAIAIIYVQMAAPTPETGEAVSEAPTTLY